MLVLYTPVTAGTTHFFRTSVTPSLRITSTVSMQHQISHYIYHAMIHNTKQYRRPTEAIFFIQDQFQSVLDGYYRNATVFIFVYSIIDRWSPS